MTARALSAFLAGALVLGCARLGGSPAVATEPWLAWQAPLGRQDALAGRIFDTAARRFVSPADAAARALRADLVLLGEKHDNPDHHQLQAWLIEALVRSGRKPAVAFEMIPRDRAGALAAALALQPTDPDAVAAALDWSQSGWPPFPLYRPIFAAALAPNLPIIPADLSRAERAQLRTGGLDALPAAERERLALDQPLAEGARQSLADEVRASHCGMVPESMVGAMIDVQRARDAVLADAVLGAAGSDGAVLIAGAGHARTDRGVPLYLARRAPGRGVLSVAFVEVPRGAPESEDPAERASQLGEGFDLVWFTPRVDDEDACERFREELEKLRAPKPAPQA